MSIDQPKQQMQMDDAMPCHDMANAQNQDNTDCDNCDCQHCLKMNALPAPITILNNAAIHIPINTHERFYSRQSDGMFQPPRLLS